MRLLTDFFARNTGLLKAVRTAVQVLIGLGIDELARLVTGAPIAPELQGAIILLSAAAAAACMSEIGRMLSKLEPPDSNEKPVIGGTD